MAAKTTRKKKTRSKKKDSKPGFRPLRWLLRKLFWAGAIAMGLMVLAVVIYAGLNPPTTHTMWSEERRLGAVDQHWVDIDEVAPVMLRSVVAAEDANFCTHWGFDMRAIRAAIADGGARGGSTISQQVVKNVYFWQERSYIRKAMEGVMTPIVEAVWTKRRILEVYLNVAEFDTGVFGIEAAAQHYFGVAPDKLSARQAALLAAVLPSPKKRSASRPSSFVSKRARVIQDGAATIKRDGRAKCFE
ncbi:monofunctional biosynthetic peptidoglycan transglycosylase [Tropicibacter sp. R15_0]|uniref:monofunctional biosynthetic peptidoglycan transglycosylase n=1 Tax=Tropicibacter sp. R15_0 TaxID=2821101 RepID=UPI001ADA079D|nr:monofunctional biosynthetic peptidoglycan transglycosylase [Tropicibacter sp. R15_0]MBO9464355.1 monofunctional biosynthetic peptidoglycan transglycosylase [Tropicibacter sp. R15_0]